MERLIKLISILFVPLSLIAQDRFEHTLTVLPKRKRIPEKIITIYKAEHPILLDGVLDELPWKRSETARNFWQHFPTDTKEALAKTETRITYDENNLYISVICFHPVSSDYIVESLKRDFSGNQNDNVSFYLDPYNDLANGFVFGITPFGVQREGLISNVDRVSLDWDNAWSSEVKQYADRWIAELKIPFKSFRYDDNTRVWNLQVSRNDLQINEQSSWTRVERQYRSSSLLFTGGINWDTLPPKAGKNFTLIPYVTSSGLQISNQSIEGEADIGTDAKIGLSSALNLDLTVNPDFSQVEVDQQVTDLSRFELYFPEKRQFFLENSDLFAEFGTRSNRPFFSRRIGLTNSILGGARLSGQIGSGLRMGLLNIQTSNQRNPNSKDVPAQNFTVASIKKQIFGNSHISAIFVNKQLLWLENDIDQGYDFGDPNRYNRVYGAQYNHVGKNNRLEGNIYIFRSDDPSDTKDRITTGGEVFYNLPRLSLFWSHELVGENYNAEVGFVPRSGYFRYGPFIRYKFFPRSGIIQNHGPAFRMNTINNRDWEKTDQNISLSYDINFLNSSQLSFDIGKQYVRLSRDFDPSRNSNSDSTVVPLQIGSDYSWVESEINYRSDTRKIFSLQARLSYGGFYNGTRLNSSWEVNYRIPPIINFSITGSYNQIDLPDPHGDANLWLAGFKSEITFTNNVYWTTYIQYNTQADNLNINTRLQWRFQPVSDLYLVYTNNYLPGDWISKNRSVVLKASYWFNL